MDSVETQLQKMRRLHKELKKDPRIIVERGQGEHCLYLTSTSVESNYLVGLIRNIKRDYSQSLNVEAVPDTFIKFKIKIQQE